MIQPHQKPNIIFIVADQLAATFLNCYGSGVDSTPALDRLAGEGTRFTRYYATSPVCAPNRATMLTGRSPVVHGIISNNYALATDMPTYAHVLRRHGYHTAGFGKFHQTPMQLGIPETVDFLGFEESVPTHDHKWGPWLEWVRTKFPEHYKSAVALCWECHGSEEEKKAHEKSRKLFLSKLNADGHASSWMFSSPLPSKAHDTTYITELSLEYLKRRSERVCSIPFFCHISFVDPHDPYDPPCPYDAMFDPDDMPEPTPAEWLEKSPSILDESRNFGDFRKICTDVEAIKKMRAMYHGSLRYMDDQIARIVDYVKNSDLCENTIIIFTTDHGDMMGDQELATKGVKHYDKGIRCPLIVAGKGIAVQTTDRLTCTLDLFPSFCDWAGVGERSRPPLEGRSFTDICEGQSEEQHPWNEIAVTFGPVNSVITDDNWRLTIFNSNMDERHSSICPADRIHGQMFDLTNDPNEQRNLYRDPLHTRKRRELFERLTSIITRPFMIPQYRNLPVVSGKKCHVETKETEYADLQESGIEYYQNDNSPYL